MFDKVIENINLGFKERTIAFFILWFAIYGSCWTILEPLVITIADQEKILWRILFTFGTLALNFLIYFPIFYRKKLEIIGLASGDTHLFSTVRSRLKQNISKQIDGFQGLILVVSASSGDEYLDWHIKASAHKAIFLTITYKPENDLIFYANVNVLSKNNIGASQKWLRFEPSRSIPQSTNDDEEMGVPVIVTDDNGMLRVLVNLSKTINNAYGAHGWKYDKVLIIRARGSGKIKNIVLK